MNVKTKWFPFFEPPVRPGVYETRYWNGGGFSRWDGERWSWEEPTVFRASRAHTKGASQDKSWRGLAKKP